MNTVHLYVRFQVHIAARMKMAVFRRIVWKKFIDVSEILVSSVIEDIIALTMETAGMSQMSVNFYQTTRRNVPEHSRLQSICFAVSMYIACNT